jgi:hypothetical protein
MSLARRCKIATIHSVRYLAGRFGGTRPKR